MGLFEHFPYTNFHDLNLDVILKRVKDAEAAAASSAEEAAGSIAQAEAAVSTANAANTTANAANTTAQQALNSATSANTAAQQAISDAAAALAAAEASEFEIINIQCDRTNHTATVQSSYTWDELYNLVANNKVLFRLKDSGFSSDMIPTPFRPRIQEGGSQPASLNSAVWVDGFYTAWGSGTPYNAVYIQRVWLMNGLTGTYYVGYADVTAI